MSFIGYKVTLFLLNNLWLCKLFAVLWLFFMIFCGNCPFRWQRIVQKSNCWLNFILPTLVMAKLKQVWHCSSNLTSWFYFMPSIEPTLKRSGERGWFYGCFLSDSLSWNNFAEHFGRMGKKRPFRNLIV